MHRTIHSDSIVDLEKPEIHSNQGIFTLQELYNLGRNGHFDDSVLFGVVNCAFVYRVYIVVCV